MYTDEDLDNAVKQGIFSASAVAEFRLQHARLTDTAAVDEENFRLIGGFNDIFVVIACTLLLLSSWWVLESHAVLAWGVFSALAWGLAEFFVRRRRMALPAIVLLLAFVAGIAMLVQNLMSGTPQETAVWATGISALAAYWHWRRFQVPITVAAGTAALIAFSLSGLLNIFPTLEKSLWLVLLVAGISAFAYAMYWDASDRGRTTRRSDVAFWLHLLAAPLIIHPIFSGLGILDGEESIGSLLVVILLYLTMTAMSLAIDRRAFMVSSLIYVLYALSSLFNVYGFVGYSFALTGVVIGTALLLLSAFWHSSRKRLVLLLPQNVQRLLPPADQGSILVVSNANSEELKE